jgi:hypothetical protein
VEHNTALYIGLLGVVIAICGMSIAYRLQKLGAQRVDAEKRAAVAYAELNRTTKELRTRMNSDPGEGSSLKPGERLRQKYPGVQRQIALPDGESS